mmetsp:Transcript_3149/g.6358  ORF Transcript_3149/g.6358 Transcript_3149/m.6358 type:complete len:201 (-) Transcript_3149:406-1008(-)
MLVLPPQALNKVRKARGVLELTQNERHLVPEESARLVRDESSTKFRRSLLTPQIPKAKHCSIPLPEVPLLIPHDIPEFAVGHTSVLRVRRCRVRGVILRRHASASHRHVLLRFLPLNPPLDELDRNLNSLPNLNLLLLPPQTLYCLHPHQPLNFPNSTYSLRALMPNNSTIPPIPQSLDQVRQTTLVPKLTHDVRDLVAH